MRSKIVNFYNSVKVKDIEESINLYHEIMKIIEYHEINKYEKFNIEANILLQLSNLDFSLLTHAKKNMINGMMEEIFDIVDDEKLR